MKIITCNVNGIRSAGSKGFWDWLRAQQADHICLQEVRCQSHHLPDITAQMPEYECHYQIGNRPGYSGVALLTRHKPDAVIAEMGWRKMDEEGRFLRVDIGRLSLMSVYFPSGTSGEARQKLKMQFLKRFSKLIKTFNEQDRDFVICGDINIAHKAIDLKNWKGNQKNSGFLPEERAWMDALVGEHGFVDAFRVVNQEPDQYTWWSQRGQAYAKNVGWRIDYQIVSPGLKSKVLRAAIFKEKKFSDHAPLIIEYSS